jgi:hypothetical protein
MRSPLFLEIWLDRLWFEYWVDFQPLRSREYYKVRSIVRMAIWIPFFVGIFYIYVGAVAVFS